MRGRISIEFSLKFFMKHTPLDKIKTTWERDLSLSIPEDTRDMILKQVHSSSKCACYSLLQFKVVHRAHISKMKLLKMYSELSPNCDKCNSPGATLIHMFWLCPSLEKFWKEVFHYPIEPNPLMSLFGVT